MIEARTLRRLNGVNLITVWTVLPTALLISTFVSLGVGRYPVSIERVLGILVAHVVPLTPFWSETDARVVELVRLPRILAAVLTGAGLGLSGASLQGMFRNPLVGPQIIGVVAGAGFGGALGILFFTSGIATLAFAFIFGIGALAAVYWVSRVDGQSPVLTLVLAGIVTGAFFTALTSLIKFVADPYEKLPAIVFWLMGSFAGVTYPRLLLVAPVVMSAGALLYALRWRINVLSLGDEDAAALGVDVERVRWAILLCVSAISAAVVAVSGMIGWVGLVIPHIARMLVGPDHRVLLPASALLGGTYLLLIDDLARTLTPAEIPIGILTAVIGAPVFGYLLKRLHTRGWVL